jgi:hypothetical protein
MPRATPRTLLLAAAAIAAAAAGGAPTAARAQLLPSRPPPAPASSAACAVGRPSVELAAPAGGAAAHPFSPEQAAEFLANQAKPSVLSHYTTTFDCVDSR